MCKIHIFSTGWIQSGNKWQRRTSELSITMRLEMKPLISHLNPAQCSAHARLTSCGAMIEILNIEDLELNVSLQCRRECVWWGAWKFHLDQCSVMAACPRYRWQHINTSNPGHRVTQTRAPQPAFLLCSISTPFSAHDFPAPCPVLPIFAAFRFEPHSKYLGCPLCGERVAPPVARLQDTFITPTTWPRQAARHVATRGDTGHVEINPDQISL